MTSERPDLLTQKITLLGAAKELLNAWESGYLKATFMGFEMDVYKVIANLHRAVAETEEK